MSPAVSIIIPVWNGETHIRRAVASAANQTLADIEIIAIDDGSTDATKAILLDLAHEEPRLRIVSTGRNNGPGAARNVAIGLAAGRWIAPLDADDIISPARLETLVAIAEAQGLDFLADNMILFDDASGRAERLAFPVEWMDGRELTLADLLQRDQPHCAPATEFGYAKPIMRRAYLLAESLHYAEDLRVGEDFDLYARALLAGARFATHPAALYAAERRETSLSVSDEGLASVITGSERLQRLVPPQDRNVHALLEERLNALAYAALLRRIKERRMHEGLELLTAIPKPYLARRIAEAAARRFTPAGQAHNPRRTRMRYDAR